MKTDWTKKRCSLLYVGQGCRSATFDNFIPGGHGYAINHANQITLNGVAQAEYLYNALGQQVVRRLTQSGQTIHSVHDLNGNRIAEYDYDPSTQLSTLIREYVWMGGMIVAVIENDAVYSVRTDHIGRPIYATDGAGVKVWEASYLPFGGVHASTGANSDLRFPGQWFHSESGLHQNWMRDYDPTTGRYIQGDPLGLVDGARVYGCAFLAGVCDRVLSETRECGIGGRRPAQARVDLLTPQTTPSIRRAIRYPVTLVRPPFTGMKWSRSGPLAPILWRPSASCPRFHGRACGFSRFADAQCGARTNRGARAPDE